MRWSLLMCYSKLSETKHLKTVFDSHMVSECVRDCGWKVERTITVHAESLCPTHSHFYSVVLPVYSWESFVRCGWLRELLSNSLWVKRGGLSLTSVSLTVTVVVPDNPPRCPPMSLAWSSTRYWSWVSLSMSGIAVRRIPEKHTHTQTVASGC